MKYEVNFFTIEIKDGQTPITNSQDFEFTNENPLEARRAAIAKTKELYNNCISDDTFDSGMVAAFKEYKSTKGFSIDIWLVDGEDTENTNRSEIHVFGEDEDEEKGYELQAEADLFNKKGFQVETIILYHYDESIEVIAEDWEFFLNS